MSLPANVKMRIKQLELNSVIVLTAHSELALAAARAAASSLASFVRDNRIPNCHIIITTPEVGISAYNEETMRKLGWVRATTTDPAIARLLDSESKAASRLTTRLGALPRVDGR